MTKQYTLKRKSKTGWITTTYMHDSSEEAMRLLEASAYQTKWARCYEVVGINFWGDEKLKLVWGWKNHD